MVLKFTATQVSTMFLCKFPLSVIFCLVCVSRLSCPNFADIVVGIVSDEA